jgi:predicted acylesterase/phospholipase RssA
MAHPEAVRVDPAPPPESDNPVTFEQVLRDELGCINRSRPNRNVSSTARAENLTGLAFSGGGIRSATFNLGILQALAEKGLLHQFDYLSTVSGGGYIGSWLAALTRRFTKEC